MKNETVQWPTNWGVVSYEEYLPEVMDQYKIDRNSIEWHVGFLRTFCEKGGGRWKFESERMRELLEANNFPLDPQLQKTQNRREMQTVAEANTRTGEPRWHMLDRECYENRSSMCSIVGFFIGYSCAEGKHKAGTTTSRVGEAENKMRWRFIPPLGRKDNLHEKNASLARMRAGHTADPSLIDTHKHTRKK